MNIELRFVQLEQADPDCHYSDEAKAAAARLLDFLSQRLGETPTSFGLVAGEAGCPCVVVQNIETGTRLDIDVSLAGKTFQVVFQNRAGMEPAVSLQHPHQLSKFLERGFGVVSYG